MNLSLYQMCFRMLFFWVVLLFPVYSFVVCLRRKISTLDAACNES